MNKKELINKLNNAYDVKAENKNKFIRKIKKSNIICVIFTQVVLA